MSSKDKEQNGRGRVTVRSEDPVVVFSYTELDSETRKELQTETAAIHKLDSDVLGGIVDMGERFIRVRDLLRHNKTGGFKGWLQVEGFGRSFAYRCIDVYKSFGNCPNLGQLKLGMSVIYALSAPSVPDEARDEVIERAANGETITDDAAKEIKAKHTPPPPPPLVDEPTYEDDEFSQEVSTDDVPARNLDESDVETGSTSTLPPVSAPPARNGTFTPVWTRGEPARPKPGTPDNIADNIMAGTKPSTPEGRAPVLSPTLGKGHADNHVPTNARYVLNMRREWIDTTDGHVLTDSEIGLLLNTRGSAPAQPVVKEPTLTEVSKSLKVEIGDLADLTTEYPVEAVVYAGKLIEAMGVKHPLDNVTMTLMRLKAALPQNGAATHQQLFGAICEAFGYPAKLTVTERKRIGGVAKELVAVGATVEDIKGLYAYCKSNFDNFSDKAFTTSWSAYKASKTAARISNLNDDVPFTDESAAAVLNGMTIIRVEGQPA